MVFFEFPSSIGESFLPHCRKRYSQCMGFTMRLIFNFDQHSNSKNILFLAKFRCSLSLGPFLNWRLLNLDNMSSLDHSFGLGRTPFSYQMLQAHYTTRDLMRTILGGPSIIHFQRAKMTMCLQTTINQLHITWIYCLSV